MQLRYLETENFLSHRREQVAFPAGGIFLLSGESGAGKSSFIVDAVAFALYGVVATRARKGSDLVNHAAPGEELHVKATFDFADGRRITLARGIDARGSSWAQAYGPDPDDPEKSELLAEGATPVGQVVRRELGGMTWQQFHAAFVARQSEIAMLTSLRGAERKLLVQRMLGMRELDKAGEMVTERLRRSNAEREQLQKAVGEFDLLREREALEADEAEAKDFGQRVKSLREQAAASKKQIEGLEERIAPLRSRVEAASAAESVKREKEELEKTIPGLEKALELHLEAEAALGAIDGIEGAVSEAEGERDRLREIFRLSRERGKQREKLEGLRDDLLEAKKEVPPPPGSSTVLTEITLAEARRMAGAAASEKALHEKAVQEKLAQIERLEGSGECFVCQRPFVGEHDHIDVIGAIREEISSLEQQIEECSRTSGWFSEAEGNLERSERLETAIRACLERLGELDETGAREDMDAVLAEGEKAGARLRELQTRRAEAEARRRDLAPTAAEDLQKARTRLAEMPQPGEIEAAPTAELAEAERELGEAQGELARLQGQIPEAERALGETERRLEQRREALGARERELENLDALRSRVSRLERLQTYLKAYGKHLSHEIRPALEEIGSEMIRRVSAGKHVAMHIDDDYEIELEEAGGQRLRASMISGGESIRANICLRLALTRLVTQRTGVPVGFLIFDEPLPSQDPGHIERIMELLDSLRPFYPQQFLISHVGELRSRDEVDYLLEFGDGPLGLVQA